MAASASRTIRSLYSAVNDRRFGRSGEVALSGTPERAASRTVDAVPSRGAAAADFLTDMFSIVTETQLALDGNYDRVSCLKHVGTEGRQPANLAIDVAAANNRDLHTPEVEAVLLALFVLLRRLVAIVILLRHGD